MYGIVNFDTFIVDEFFYKQIVINNIPRFDNFTQQYILF